MNISCLIVSIRITGILFFICKWNVIVHIMLKYNSFSILTGNAGGHSGDNSEVRGWNERQRQRIIITK